MLRNTMLRLRGKHGLLAVVALAAAVIALGGSSSARAGFFTGNTTGFSSITADGQTATLIGSEYDLFLPSNYVQSTVPVIVTAVSSSNKVSIGTQSGLVASPDTFSVGVGDGATVSICTPSASSTGDPNNCDHFNLGIFATANFDTNLKALSVSPGGVSFTWSLSNEATSYSTRVPFNTSSVTVNASSEDPLASVSINGVAGSSQSVSVAHFGLTNIPVKVTAADGTDSLTYTIAVTAGSNDANLSNLAISPGAITGFSPSTTTYDVKVPSSATQVNVTPTKDDPNAYWFINEFPAGTTVQEETDSLPHPITLNATDPTTLMVIVSGSDSIADKVYTINITHLVSRQLNVAFAGTGSGVVKSTSPDTVINCASPSTGTCTTHYDETSSVTLSETPAVGSYFVSWGGDCSGPVDTTSTFTMPSRTATCTANFASLGPKQTSPFKVTTGKDLNDGGCYANRCSLRDALAAASSTGGTITFAGGVTEIDTTSTLSYPGKPLTITGPVTIDGAGLGGGSIFVLGGTATLNKVTFSDAPENALFASGTLTMTGGGLENNGGGPSQCAGFEISGTATMTNVSVTGNQALGDDPFDATGGGGCVENGASLTVTGSVFANNSAFLGAGIYDDGKLSVLNTQFQDNGWPFEFDTGPGGGAGIFVDDSGTAIVTNATFNDNGGADALDSTGPVKLVSSTVAGNEYGIGGAIAVLDSIVDGNFFFDCGGGVTSLGHNLVGLDCPFGGPGDRTADDPGVGPVTPAGLVPLLNGSPALDAGFVGTVSGVTVPTTDAAGTSRPQGGGVDIGAMEMPEHKLTIKTAGGGTGTVAPDAPATPATGIAPPGGWYVAGSSVQLTATPTGGAAFAGWSGACTGNANPTTVAISADETCTATFAPKPVVTSFAPSSARVGTTVTITGSKFTGVTGVAFGDMPATSFKVVSDTTITAVVPINAATGVITVSNGGLSTDSANTFTYVWVKPAIAAFTPATGKSGAAVTLTGTDFLGTTEVDFGGVAGTALNVLSDTKITVNVPANAVTGPITAINPGGTGQSKTNFTFLPPPTITSFAPEDAVFGATVTITGSHFTGTTAVGVAGVAVKFTVVNDGTITFVVPTNEAQAPDKIVVTNAGGQAVSVDSFTLDWATPTITSFTPTTARIRATVTITGTNFTRATEVDFGDASPSFTVVSDTKITAVVPDTVGTDPVPITVKRPGGTPGTSASNFTPLWPAPKITSFTPASAKAGATVTITGTGFLGASEFDFNGHSAPLSGTVTDTSVKVIVPNNLDDTGKVSVTTPGGTGMSATNFTFLSAPVITTFTGDAAFGATVTITGSHLTGTTAVKIGGAIATFHVVNDGQVTATVPVAASNTPGPISVTNANGTTLSGSNFTLDWATPTITSFTPGVGRIRSVVTLTGTNFTRASEVDFGTDAAPSFTVVSDTKITVVVPDDAVTSAITVNRPGGSPGVSGADFILTWPQPTITSFTPASAKAGATVTVNGTGFLGETEVDFHGHSAAVTGTVTDTKLTVTVPNNLDDTGKISVTTVGGTGVSPTNFTFLSPPVITTFTGDAAFGATVTINGSHFTGTTAVKIGGATATFHVASDGQVTASVPTGASNTPAPISVTNANGTTLSASNFTLDWATPTVTSFTPATARIRAIVTLTGTNFTRASEVDFGSHASPTFTVVSDTKITAVVPDTVGTSPVAITVARPGGTPGTSGSSFTPLWPAPKVTSFTPASAKAGATVTVAGTGFLGASEIDFNGHSAAVSGPVTDTSVKVIVPDNLDDTGKITLSTPGGTGTSATNFTFLSAPVITTFTGDAAFGATVTINGSHFTGTTAVKIGGATATFHVVGDGQVTATVPTGASNTPGPISITNAYGTTLSGSNFTLDWATPTITSFTPTTGRIGTKITITGTHFTRATGVMIGSTPATNVTVVSDTSITAVVPTNVAAGVQHITVSNPGATSAASAATFTPTLPTPTITSFTPTTGFSGVTVTLTGTGFLGATEVDIGGAAALTFTVVSDTKITVVVPTLGATGKISVTTAGGTGMSAGTFTISA